MSTQMSTIETPRPKAKVYYQISKASLERLIKGVQDALVHADTSQNPDIFLSISTSCGSPIDKSQDALKIRVVTGINVQPNTGIHYLNEKTFHIPLLNNEQEEVAKTQNCFLINGVYNQLHEFPFYNADPPLESNSCITEIKSDYKTS